MKTYRLKLTALSPIHIGTGEVYEPTNFIIDDGYLYEFDEVLFLKSLNELEQKSFSSKLQDYIQIIDFYKNHKDKAKQIYQHRVMVTKKVEEKYNTKINKDGSKNKNQLEIQKTYKNPNTNFLVIPGSSLKGVFDTFLKIYPPKESNEIRQQLQLSDALVIDNEPKIGYCYRRHKDPSKNARSSIPQIVEIIPSDTSFLTTIKTNNDFEELKNSARNYYANKPDSKYSEDDKSFVIRVGKFSGKDYVSDVKNVKNSYGKPIATHTLYEDDTPFGWLRVELISEDKYKELLSSILKKEKEYYNSVDKRQKEIKEQIQAKKQKQLEEKLKKEQEAAEEQKRIEEEARKKEQMLASMTPFERKVNELVENDKSNTPKETLLLKAIKEDYFEDKKEALEYLKKYMQENNLWVEVSKAKKPEKDKKYKRTQEIIKMLDEYKS